MKQKEINIKIFEELSKEPSHQRELARKIKTSQTQIRRKLKEFEENNIVDYKVKGKNTVYFIKKSIESKLYKRIIENEKLFLILIKNKKIRKIFKEIQKNIEENKIKKDRIIVLFGSYAKEEETEKSDIDIYLDSNLNKEKELIENISEIISIKTGKFHEKGLLEKEIIKNHIILNNVEGFLNIIE